jgi:hypothetical protein
MLYDTREWHKSGGIKNELSTNEEHTGYTDTFNLKLIPVQEGIDLYGAFAQSQASYTNKHPMIIVTGKLTDPKYQKSFGSFSNFACQSAKIDGCLTVDHSLLQYCKEPTLIETTTFSAIAKVNGKSVCVADCTLELTATIPQERLVKGIKVNAPCPKKPSNADIRIVYNRREDKEAAYKFKEAKRNGSNVNVYYPFSIEVTLNDKFIFNSEKPVQFDHTLYISLASTVMDGEVCYNTTKWDKIKANLPKPNVLELSFPYSSDDESNYWGTDMVLTKKQIEGYFNFHLNFGINCKPIGAPEFLPPIQIIVSSEDLIPSDNFVRINKQSKIVWGCLGKDTLIRMANGDYKPVSEISKTEELFTNKGGIALKNMVKGTEEKIIAVSVSEEKTLFITKEHPIATERGVICAKDLSISDRLQLEDGKTFKDIIYLELVDYNDEVYSPELEQSALISADGIMVGDYLTPIDAVDKPAPIVEALEPELLEELKRWVYLRNEQLKKEVNI